MVREVKLRIVLQNPIEGVLYGLQKGKGANYESLQPQLGEGKDLTFEFSVQVKQANSRGISLTGPSVQGPAGSRFVYIDIGSYAGQAEAKWNGRQKFPFLRLTLRTPFPKRVRIAGLAQFLPEIRMERLSLQP
jgi:hypothetical protein